MSSKPYPVRLSRVFHIPPAFDFLLEPVDTWLEKMGVSDFGLDCKPLSLPPVTDFSLPPISQKDYLKGLKPKPFDPNPPEPPPEQLPPPPSYTFFPLYHQTLDLHITALSEITFDLAGLEGVSLVLNPGDFVATLTMKEQAFSLNAKVRCAVRFGPDLLRPMQQVTSTDGKVHFEPDRDKTYVQVDLGEVEVKVDSQGNVGVGAGVLFKLGCPAMIGDTGVILAEADVVLNLEGKEGQKPAGAPPGWCGLFLQKATVRLPDLFDGAITAQNLGISQGGISGVVSYSGAELAGSVLGMTGALASVKLAFQQNIPVESEIRGWVRLPFFQTKATGDDPKKQRIEVVVSLGLAGNLMVRLGGSSGVSTLTLKDILELQVQSLSFSVVKGVSRVSLSGRLRPKLAGFKWPSFDVRELVIDSRGHVHVDGGWQDLPQQKTFEFYGFRMEITKLGFGQAEDRRQWVGFSGGIKLIDGLPAGASVEGLRILWDDKGQTELTFNGVDVEFEVPEVMRFKGAVAYQPGSAKADVVRFDGAIRLELLALDMVVDAKLVVGSEQKKHYSFFAIYVGLDLPAAIPLWATGLGLYGMAGLFAANMEPDKKKDEPWYGMGRGEGWYKRSPVGVAHLKKWTNEQGSLALGAGITIGTLPDSGYTFSGKMLLAIVFPGPILLIEGKANLLRSRAALDKEPNFRALAVLDARQGSFLFGLDAQYKYDEKGRLIDIQGGAEAFFSFNDPGAWHLYVGNKTPKEKRIRARMLSLFKANAYFMLDARQFATGAWIGFANRWDFGIAALTLEAWIDGNAVVSWSPAHFHGDLWLHGKIGLRVLFLKLGLTVDAYIAADVFEPFHLLAGLKVTLDLPWPLPDLKADLRLEWGPKKDPPPRPLPLKEVAVEHLKVTTSWPLARGTYLLPNYDPSGNGMLQLPTHGVIKEPAALTHVPKVPLDARPRLTFNRPMNDDACVGVNTHPGKGVWERIGDPVKNQGPVEMRFGLSGLALHKRSASGDWDLVARRGTIGEASVDGKDAEQIYGSWAPMPAMPDDGGRATAQTKLWLWSKTPFDYARQAGRTWDEWFTDHFKDYPCPGEGRVRVGCCGFDAYPPGRRLELPLSLVGKEYATQVQSEPSLTFKLLPGTVARCTVKKVGEPLYGCKQALNFEDVGKDQELTVMLSPVATSARLVVAADFIARFVRFRHLTPDPRGPNPRSVYLPTGLEIGFELLDCNDNRSAHLRLEPMSYSGTGLSCRMPGDRLVIRFPGPVIRVDLNLTMQSVPTEFVIFEEDGSSFLQSWSQSEVTAQTVTVKGKAITRVDVCTSQGETHLHEVRFVYRPPVAAMGIDVNGNPLSSDAKASGIIQVKGQGLERVALRCETAFYLAHICASFPPDEQERLRREKMRQHTITELKRWQQKGNVLEPHTIYRLTLVTQVQARGDQELIKKYKTESIVEYAYFQTDGPPGVATLSIPENHPAKDEYDSGLESLEAYVRQTVPATVPGAGEKPRLPRPVYRAYDVGVEFNEDYVDLMYRLGGRDLRLYLYDRNGRPVRDVLGRLIVQDNPWSEAETRILSRTDKQTVTTYNASTCLALGQKMITRDKTLFAANEKLVLAPDTVFEARLTPLLLHEDFYRLLGRQASSSGAKLGNWTVHNLTGSSRWETKGHKTLSGGQTEIVGTVFQLDGAPVLAGLRTPANDPSREPDYLLLGEGAGGVPQSCKIMAYDDTANTVTVGGIVDLEGRTSPWEIPDPSLKGGQAKAVGVGLTLAGQSGPAAFQALDSQYDSVILESDQDRASRRYQILSIDVTARIVGVDGHPRLKGGSSQWEIPAQCAVEQTEALGSSLLLGGKTAWTDYRISAILRATARADGFLGVVFRVQNGNYYGFFMAGGAWRMVRHVQGNTFRVPSGDFACEPHRDYFVTAEAIGQRLRLHLDGVPVFDGADLLLGAGQVGLCCANHGAARFSDVRVDDLRERAPVVYRFAFSTSRFANFYHHIHSFQDEIWTANFKANQLTAATLKALVDQANGVNNAPSAGEAAGYKALSGHVWKATVRQQPHELQITRVNWQNKGLAFLLQSPEPIDWGRVRVQVFRDAKQTIVPAMPGAVKLTEATLSGPEPNKESVTLLLRDAVDLSGYHIEFRKPPAGGGEATWETYYIFDKEQPCAAGTLVRIYSGSPDNAPNPGAGLVQRFITPPKTQGRRRLTSSRGVTMRVVDCEGRLCHLRHFRLPTIDCTDLSNKVLLLRSKDGTGFFILVRDPSNPIAAGSHIKEGEYRLRLTYRRDNRKADPESQLLSQAGLSTAEKVSIDIPWLPRYIDG